jgi:hypothetical protein
MPTDINAGWLPYWIEWWFLLDKLDMAWLG